jgi:hypothetical protein
MVVHWHAAAIISSRREEWVALGVGTAVVQLGQRLHHWALNLLYSRGIPQGVNPLQGGQHLLGLLTVSHGTNSVAWAVCRQAGVLLTGAAQIVVQGLEAFSAGLLRQGQQGMRREQMARVGVG